MGHFHVVVVSDSKKTYENELRKCRAFDLVIKPIFLFLENLVAVVLVGS